MAPKLLKSKEMRANPEREITTANRSILRTLFLKGQIPKIGTSTTLNPVINAALAGVVNRRPSV